jgi:lysine decarboxylase/arginine decarboxylase
MKNSDSKKITKDDFIDKQNHQSTNQSRKQQLKLLLIDDDKKWMKDFIELFDKMKYPFEKINSIHISIKAFSEYTPSLKEFIDEIGKFLESDKSIDIQGILLDWVLDPESKRITEKTDLIKLIKSLRPEIPIFILTYHDGYSIMDEVDSSIEMFFNKPTENVGDIEGIIDKIVANFKERKKSPFYDAYKEYVTGSSDSWHTPGHFKGKSFRKSDYIYDFYDFFGRTVFSGDLSVSVGGLGSLLDSTGPIKK